MNSISIAFSIALILAYVDYGSCLSCYSCNSLNNLKCASPATSETPLFDCDSLDAKKEMDELFSFLPELFKGIVAGLGDSKFCVTLTFGSGSTSRSCILGNKADPKIICEILKELTKSSDPERKVTSCIVCDQHGCY